MGNTHTSRAIGKGDKEEELRVVSHRRRRMNEQWGQPT